MIEPHTHTEFRLQSALRAARDYNDAHAYARGPQNPMTLEHEARAVRSGDIFMKYATDNVLIEYRPEVKPPHDDTVRTILWALAAFVFGAMVGGLIL